jgi:thioredoxin reductase (NADPH)
MPDNVRPGALLDCLVVGGGPAGSTAALYLSRFRRQIAVFDTEASRAKWIPRSHNLPGFPNGAHGPDLLAALQRQLKAYDVQVVHERVTEVERQDDGFLIHAGDRDFTARTVLLCTGIVEVLPPVAHIAEAIKSGAVRVCPICDGFEARDRRLAVLGRGDHAGNEALFLRTYSGHVAVVVDREDTVSADLGVRLGAAQVGIVHADLQGITLRDGGARIMACDGAVHDFDLVYAAYGVTAQTRPVRGLGPAVDDHGRLWVGEHQETSVAGLYAAGDIVRGLNQISVAEGEAAIAATAIHNRLQLNYR